MRKKRDYNWKYHVTKVLWQRYGEITRQERGRFLERFAEVESGRLTELGVKPFPKMAFLFGKVFDEL